MEIYVLSSFMLEFNTHVCTIFADIFYIQRLYRKIWISGTKQIKLIELNVVASENQNNKKLIIILLLIHGIFC
jgi:hypothetical protein